MLTQAAVERRLREAVAPDRIASTGSERTGISAGLHEHDRATGDIAETMAWLRWLNSEDAALVKARLEGARWKLICWRFGISRPTAHRRWRHSIRLIAWHLSGRTVPAGCSRRRFNQLSARM